MKLADERTQLAQGRRLRPHGRRRGQRAHLVGAARLPGAHLVRHQGQRQGRRAEHPHAPDPRLPHRRADPELVHGRPRRRLRRVRQAHVPLQRRARRASARRLEGHLRELGHRQAQPGRRGLGHHADDPARRLRGHHRQRRPDERRRVPQGQAPARRPARRLRGAGVRARRERHRELAARLGPVAHRREQLRLPEPVRPAGRHDHRAGLHPRGRRPRRPGLPHGLAQHDRARAVGRPQAVDAHADRLLVHAGPQPGGRPDLVVGRHQRAHGQAGVQAGRRRGAERQQQLRRASRSGPTAPHTWHGRRASGRCATGRAEPQPQRPPPTATRLVARMSRDEAPASTR